MIRYLFYLLSMSCCLPLVAHASQSVESHCDTTLGASIVGLAIDRSTQQALYCEYYLDDDQRSVVQYQDVTTKAMIVEKRLDFSQHALVPDVRQEDIRHDELRTVLYSPEKDHFVMTYQKNQDAEKKSAEFAIENQTLAVVTDAGFDRFIKQQWESLLLGEANDMIFLSPVHARAITLSVRESRRPRCGGLDYDAATSICFTVTPKNRLIKMFAKPISLIYDKGTQNLEVFSGVVNLVDKEGKPQTADIYYWYQSE